MNAEKKYSLNVKKLDNAKRGYMSFICQSFIKTRKLQIQQIQVPNWQTLCERKCVEESVGEREEEESHEVGNVQCHSVIHVAS